MYWIHNSVQGDRPGQHPVARDRGHAAIVRNVARAIIEGQELISPGYDAIYSLELANAILLSGHKNKPVTLPVDRVEYDAFIKERKATSRNKQNATRPCGALHHFYHDQ